MNTSRLNWLSFMLSLPAAGRSNAAASCTEAYAASAVTVTAAHSPSDVAAFDLLGKGLDQFRHLVEVRIDRKRFAEGFKRALVVAETLHDHARAGQRTEMTGLASQPLLDILERVGVVVLQVIPRRPPVPGLDIIRPQLDH